MATTAAILGVVVDAAFPMPCASSDTTGSSREEVPVMQTSAFGLYQCRFPNELTLRPGVVGFVDLEVITAAQAAGPDAALLLSLNEAFYFSLTPTILLSMTCANRSEYIIDQRVLVTGFSTFDFRFRRYEFEVNSSTTSPRATPLLATTDCKFFIAVRTSDFLNILLAKNETAAPVVCNEVAIDARVRVVATCEKNFTAGIANNGSLFYGIDTLSGFSLAAFPERFVLVLRCDARGVSIVGASEVLTTRIFIFPNPVGSAVVGLRLARDLLVNTSLHCSVSLFESLDGDLIRREYISQRTPIACAVVSSPPPRLTTLKTATCEPLVLGTNNIDALGVDVCRVTNDGLDTVLGAQFNCSDPVRYHATQGRINDFDTYSGSAAPGECKRMTFSLVLSGSNTALRNDVVCTFQGLDTDGFTDVGVESRTSVTCTSERLRDPSAPVPTPPTPPTPPPTNSSTTAPPSQKTVAGLPLVVGIVIAVCALIATAVLIRFFVGVCRKPRPVLPPRKKKPVTGSSSGVGDAAKSSSDSRPLLPTTAKPPQPVAPTPPPARSSPMRQLALSSSSSSSKETP